MLQSCCGLGSPEGAPADVGLAEVDVRGGLSNKVVHLRRDRKRPLPADVAEVGAVKLALHRAE